MVFLSFSKAGYVYERARTRTGTHNNIEEYGTLLEMLSAHAVVRSLSILILSF